jgi:hypothetical protein
MKRGQVHQPWVADRMRTSLITRRRLLAGFGASSMTTLGVGGYALGVAPMWRLNVTR